MLTPLLADEYAPITSEIGFIESDVADVADAYMTWQGALQAKRGVALSARKVNAGLETCIRCLLPLTSVERRRFLFVPTASAWTAYFDNGWQGADAYSGTSYLCEILKCRGVRSVYVPHSLDELYGGAGGRYGSAQFELYAGRKTDFINTERSVALGYDGNRWSFTASGTVQDFELVSAYTNRSVRQRFTPEMLRDYLMALGIRAFEVDYYAPHTGAVLVRKDGPAADAMKEYSLEEARRSPAGPAGPA